MIFKILFYAMPSIIPSSRKTKIRLLSLFLLSSQFRVILYSKTSQIPLAQRPLSAVYSGTLPPKVSVSLAVLASFFFFTLDISF